MARSTAIDRAVRSALYQLPPLLEKYGAEIEDEPCAFDVRQGELVVTRARDGREFSLDRAQPRKAGEN
jgi:hypothetical protein